MNHNIPLAEKLRPKTLDDVLGQEHLTGKNGTIRKMLENDTLNSLIFWGPPGTGKTRMAEQLLAGPYDGFGKIIQFHPNIVLQVFLL